MINPNVFAYPSAAEVVPTRTLQEIKDTCLEMGYQIIQDPVNGVMIAAVIETANTCTPGYQDGEALVTMFWDFEGRLVRGFYAEDRGIRPNPSVNNIFVYDNEGRLIRRYQVHHGVGELGTDVIMQDRLFDYQPDRPLVDYILRYRETGDDEYITLTPEERWAIGIGLNEIAHA